MRAIYEIDWQRWTLLVLPPHLRGAFMRDWVLTLLGGIRALQEITKAAHRANLTRANYNSQKVAMELLMNDLFDPQLRNIRIIDTASLTLPDYTFFRSEGRSPEYVFNRSEDSEQYRDFRSELTNPPDATFELPYYTAPIRSRIVALIGELLNAGVTYEIVETYPVLPPGVVSPTYE